MGRDKENLCANCHKKTPERELKWNDGLCKKCFDEGVDDPPIWTYFNDYNWNKK